MDHVEPVEGAPVPDAVAEPTAVETVVDPTAGSERRTRFRESIRAVANRSSSSDLLRWVLIPASILLLLGFNFMIFAWVGASRTARQIEQIPYLISGGLIGLGLVIVGALLLASAFWVVLVKKLLEESEERTRARAQSEEAELVRTVTSVDGSTPTAHSEPSTKAKPRGRVPRSTVTP
jgi:hypothetical protein